LKELEEIKKLKQQIDRTQARIDVLQDEYGSNLESESELRRLKLLKKIIKPSMKTRKKKFPRLKNKPKTNKRSKKRFQEKERSSTKLLKKEIL